MEVGNSGSAEHWGLEGGLARHMYAAEMSLYPPEKYTYFLHDLLMRLGITPNYLGFRHTACAVALAVESPLRLRAVTRLLYPQVAQQCATTPQCVERNIRTALRVAQEKNPQLLSQVARRPVSDGITGAEFVSILTMAIRQYCRRTQGEAY